MNLQDLNQITTPKEWKQRALSLGDPAPARHPKAKKKLVLAFVVLLCLVLGGGTVLATEIVQHFQQVIGAFPRSALDKLQSYREVFTKELICRAFDEAAESGVRNWRYIDGILRGWQADGVRTLGDVEARREARRKPKPQQEKKMEVLT